MSYWRCALGDNEVPFAGIEFYLNGEFEEVWKLAEEFLRDMPWDHLTVYRPTDDTPAYYAEKSGAVITGAFIPRVAA